MNQKGNAGQNGSAQIAVSIEPTVSNAIQQGAHVVFSYPDAWGPFALTGLMTTEDFAAKNPQTVQGFVNAYECSLNFIRQNPQGAVQIAKHYFPQVSDSVLTVAVNRLITEKVFPQHAVMSLASWDAAIDLREEVGDLPKGNYDALDDQVYGTSALQLSK